MAVCWLLQQLKAFDADDIMQFSDAAKIAIVVERSLHDDFMKNFGVTKEEFKIPH